MMNGETKNSGTIFIEKTNKIILFLITVLPVYYILSFIFIAILRMNYPFDLEWMEGTMLIHVLRINEGLPIYSSPSINFIPFIYTPAYFYISALVTKIFGTDYFALRFVSFISTIVILLFIYIIVRKETSSKLFGILSAGLFAACFEISGFWYDLARVDSLFLCFFIIAFYLIRFHKNNLSLLLSGILLALSYLTKQAALFFIIPIITYIIIDFKWKSFFLVIPCLTIIFGLSYYFNIQSNGWFYYWLFELPIGHQWVYSKVISFWTSDILNPLAFAFILSLSYFIFKIPDSLKISKVLKTENFILYLFTALGLFFCSYLSRIHLGGYDNVLMAVFLIISILFGLGLNEFHIYLKNNQITKNKVMELFFWTAIVSQFLIMFYNPTKQIPSKEDFQYGKKFIKEIQKLSNDVLIPNHPSYSLNANKPTFAHYYVLEDLFNSNSIYKESVRSEFIKSLKNKKYSAIILDHPLECKDIRKYYKLNKILFKEKDFFNCKTGACRLRPEYFYVPALKQK